ncbi:four-carbon acid sugar kinase family protein [Pelagicoccus albus]|uniref:Four-carbon acid sugar kinase family protein n=1 Tax=Pelagicoccus albus TaxID=415222 RepID=A0A7X1BA06_9BACT|nr:four-carbon acid sugar kinase family protein [Pelagicoccus albus]MBC2608079.1 four-carbon acid sugar kinase family protein [Pelagicoccus albus]
MPEAESKLKIVYYADDFTGSTDALEFLTRAGARAVLFVEPPSPEQLQRFPDLDAVGVAGLTRSMAPGPMEQRLRADLSELKKLEPRHLHYKVCSTFDSSPEIGNIGRAIETGRSVFKNKLTPVVVGAPALGRYVSFGNLYAKMGIGSTGRVYRLDRHPSISRHPVTPMKEANLAMHLAQQTELEIGVVDFPELEAGFEFSEERGGEQVLVIDTLSESHLGMIGGALERAADRIGDTLFSVGSSGVEMALGREWERSGSLVPITQFPAVDPVTNLLVVSGSCSPVTSGQIDWALENGFAEVALDTSRLANAEDSTSEKDRVIEGAVARLRSGSPVVVHTARGGEDARLARTQEAFLRSGMTLETFKSQTGKLFGKALGEIAKRCVAEANLKRVLLAGGDSSSYAARQMGIEAVEMIAPLSPGAPLCRVYSQDPCLNGAEINFKGGQVGAENYFGQVANGTL